MLDRYNNYACASESRNNTHTFLFLLSLSLSWIYIHACVMRTHMTRWKWFFHVITAVIRCHVVKCDKSFLYSAYLGGCACASERLALIFLSPSAEEFHRAARFTRDCVRRLAACRGLPAWHTHDLTDLCAGYKSLVPSATANIFYTRIDWTLYQTKEMDNFHTDLRSNTCLFAKKDIKNEILTSQHQLKRLKWKQ
jgi:hypothetical protein